MQHNKAAFAPRAKPIASVSEKSRGYDFLLIGHALYRLYPVAQLGGGFKSQLLGSFKHFGRKLLDKLSGFPAENKADLLNSKAVFTPAKALPCTSRGNCPCGS